VPKKSKDIQSENANGARSPVKKSVRKKPAARKKASKPAPAETPIKATPPSDEQIRTRAYFIAEKREQLSIKGDHHGDWLEAKRQLFAEAGIPLD
jgi:hypothetical protein